MSDLLTQTYEIRTVQDFLKVPDHRRDDCLQEFASWLAIRELTAAALLASGLRADQFRLKGADVFAWIDDGKRTATIRVTAVDKLEEE